MPRQEIKEHLGTLEEQLDLLGPLARAETLEAFRGLSELIHNDSLRKSLAANDFLARVTGVLVQEAHKLGYEISVSHFGEGRISAEMVEVSMGAILACLKASLRSYRGMGKAVRMQHNLFRSYSVYLELRADTDRIHFRLIDDGKGYENAFIHEMDQDLHFKRLRSQVASHGGWFSKRSFPGFGGTIEFQMPLPRARFECFLLTEGSFELLIPRSYCAKVVDLREAGSNPFREKELICLLDERTGLRLPAADEPVSAACAVLVCVADFQFWVLCSSAAESVRARAFPCGDFLEHGAWFQKLGLFPQQGILKSLPLLEGQDLMHFYSRWEDPHAGV